jgi:site-specific recombinase XerD
MSDKVNGSAHTTAQAAVTSIEADIAQLNQLLSQESLDDADEASVAELLARLESADGVAEGVENKLDALLGNLDSLLASLEQGDEPLTESKASQPTEKSSKS